MLLWPAPAHLVEAAESCLVLVKLAMEKWGDSISVPVNASCGLYMYIYIYMYICKISIHARIYISMYIYIYTHVCIHIITRNNKSVNLSLYNSFQLWRDWNGLIRVQQHHSQLN